MNLRIVQTGGAVSVEIGPQPRGFLRLSVSNSAGDIMWEVLAGTGRAIPTFEAEMSFVPLPETSVTAVRDALNEVTQALQQACGISDQKATAAMESLREAVQAGRKAGALSEETAAVITRALKRLSQAVREPGGPVGGGRDAIHARRKVSAVENESVFPVVREVVYGDAPNGYCETERARPLVRGERYHVLVFWGGGFEWTRGEFVCDSTSGSVRGGQANP